MEQNIVTVISNGVALITLNRPAAMNALSRALRNEFGSTLAALAKDDAVRAAILTGAGERAFSAGLDLKELGAETGAVIDATGPNPLMNPVKALELFPKPIIAAVNGVAITGGFELAMACDILIASSKARFADTHSRVGVMPGWGLSQKLSRAIGMSRAKELSLSARFLDAATALQWGLVNQVVEPEALLEAAMTVAGTIAQADTRFLIAYKALMEDGAKMNLADALAHESATGAAWNEMVGAEAIDERRAAVQDRNRQQ